jgi:hypothetical protein
MLTDDFEPRLVQAPLGSDRFVPRGDEVHVAIFEFWNLLDRNMATLEPIQRYQTGYVRELQMRRMVLELAQRPGLTYCEVGMNGGHSAASVLLANEDTVVHSFDLMSYAYSGPAAALLRLRFGSRFVVHPGNSRNTVPRWRRSTAARCDLILVDGDHSFHGAREDLLSMQHCAANRSVVIVDDTAMPPGAALRALVQQRRMRVLEDIGPYKAPSRENPCMRAPSAAQCEAAALGERNETRRRVRMLAARQCRSQLCVPWGFAVAQYV